MTELKQLPALTKSDWLATPIERVGFSESISKKLELGGIHSAGELQLLMTREGLLWNTKIRGIGDAKKTVVEDVFNDFLAEMEQSLAERACVSARCYVD